MDWSSVFDEVKPESATTLEDIAGLAQRLNHALPSSYQDFLLWSNGGWARTGHREFGLFDTQSVVEHLENYEFSEYMAGATPFALDGGGIFYVFDFRGSLIDGECPIWVCGSGANTWADAAVIASSFLEVCQGTSAASSVLSAP